jgi:TonB family protein
MIGRQLIPRDARLTAESAAARRPFSLLDERQLIPGNMRSGPLEARTAIPAHLPLGALASRVVVPRDMPATPLDWASVHPDYPPLTILDYRVTVPAATPTGTFEAKGVVPMQELPDVLPPDVITTGEINLMVERVEHPRIEWNWVARAGSLLAHAALLLLIAFQAKVFPYQPPTQEQLDIARRQLSFIYMPSLDQEPATAPAPAPRQQVRIDPRYLRELDSLDPSAMQPILGPKGAKPAAPEESGTNNAPVATAPPAPVAAPKPQPQPSPTPAPRQPQFVQPRALIAQGPGRALLLPRTVSPGRALEESAQEALRGGGGSQQFGGEIPGAPSDGGGGQGYLGGDLEMLTPTEGVDFTSYLARIVASVKRNWLSVMPESARLGEQGRVVLQFRIFRDGLVPDSEPGLMGSSGKEPLDRAAISAIRASSPFPALPPAFSGPYIELRFMFLYNLPASYR